MTGTHWIAGLATLALVGTVLAPELTWTSTAPPPVATWSGATATGSVALSASVDRSRLLAGTVDERFLTFTITPPVVDASGERAPIDLVAVFDSSGSMAEGDKISHARRAARHLVAQLGPQDTMSLVAFSDRADVLVPPTRNKDVLTRAVDRLPVGGGTNLYAGLGLAHELSASMRDPGRMERMVLLSDGRANAGITDPAAIQGQARAIRDNGMSVTTVGLGLDFEEDLMASLADVGGGHYRFVDQGSDLVEVFGGEVTRSAAVVTRGAHLTLTPAAGVTLLDVIGWQAQPVGEDGAVAIDLGELHGGMPRKVVARVRVEVPAAGHVHLAKASLAYLDLDGLAGKATASATAGVTPDARTAAQSADAEATRQAGIALGNQLLDRSSRRYEAGDVRGARDLIAEASETLSALEDLVAPDAFAKDRQQLHQQLSVYDNHTPASDEGRRAIKSGKEQFRARAR